MLRNGILGFLAIAIWTTNYLVYFAEDIRAWRRRADRQSMPLRGIVGPLPARERLPFPRPEPQPVVHDAEIIPFPRARKRRD